MREIKFRAWYEPINKMFFDVERRHSVHWWCPKEKFALERDSTEIMQFTGLKDKKGKEIYEGDVILSKYFDDRINEYVERKAEVIFEDGCFQVKKEYWKPLLISIIAVEKTWTIEVIGNIYENPELLGSEGTK